MTRALSRSGVYLVLIAALIYYLLPVYVLVTTALKPWEDVHVSTMWDFPQSLTGGGFLEAWKKIAGAQANVSIAGETVNYFAVWGDDWLGSLGNSIKIAVPAAIISSLIGSMNGYIFSKWRFRGANLIFMLVMIGFFLPYQGILIPLVLVLQRIGLYGSIPGLVFVHCVFGIPITAMMFRSFYSGIPTELVEAARIDGAGFFAIFSRIFLPLSPPAFAVVLIWQFTTIWNDFLLAVVVVSNPALAPVMLAVNNMAGSYWVEWNVQMAGALIAAIPTMVVYLLLGRLFMRGLLAGALKG
jgi:glucose/mannose transport system permease protein